MTRKAAKKTAAKKTAAKPPEPAQPEDPSSEEVQVVQPAADEPVRQGGHVLTPSGWVVEETGEPVSVQPGEATPEVPAPGTDPDTNAAPENEE